MKKQAKKELRKTIKKYLNKVGKVSGNKEIEPYLSQAEAEIGQQFDQAITTAVEEALGGWEKKINNWFEDNFHWGKKINDEVFVTEKQLYDFLQTLKNKQLK